MTKIYEVRQRDGNRGQSSLSAIVATKKEADCLKKMLEQENGGTTIQTLICERKIETIREFVARREMESSPNQNFFNLVKDNYLVYSAVDVAKKLLIVHGGHKKLI